MKRLALLICLLSLISPAAWAVSFSDASLLGAYSLQLTTPETVTWAKTFSCPSNSSITFTVYGGKTTEHLTRATVTFHGNGSWSASFTEIGQVDVTASANTASVTWGSGCSVVNENRGNVVYKAPSTGTATGTYTVVASGTGTMSGTTSTGGTVGLNLTLAGTNASGVATTVLLSEPQVNGHEIGDGIAVHQ